jgi:hypothetical protein
MKIKKSFSAFLAIVLVGSVYGFHMRYGPSTFFSNFSLAQLVKKNGSPSGLLCYEGGMGGIGGGGGGWGSKQVSYNKSESFSCRIKSSLTQEFDEEEFISSLRKDVEKDLNESGPKITRAEIPTSSSFSFEYEEGAMQGRIEINGERKEAQYYSLRASLKESGERKSE